MLHKTVVLANLQIWCPKDDKEKQKIAGQARNLFYAASLEWTEGNLGRVIPLCDYEDFYGEYKKLRSAFYTGLKDVDERYRLLLTVMPFPRVLLSEEDLKDAQELVFKSVQYRFNKRIYMLARALKEEKRFYSSLLSELEKVVNTGFFLRKTLRADLLTRLKAAQSDILCHSAEDIRRSASLKEDIINICGALL